jgi:hypothetical protein
MFKKMLLAASCATVFGGVSGMFSGSTTMMPMQKGDTSWIMKEIPIQGSDSSPVFAQVRDMIENDFAKQSTTVDLSSILHNLDPMIAKLDPYEKGIIVSSLLAISQEFKRKADIFCFDYNDEETSSHLYNISSSLWEYIKKFYN